MIARGIIVASVLVAVGGCGPDVTKRACMGGAGDNPLVTDAAMVRLDVYGPNAHCADGQLIAGAGSPILSRTYAQGQAISLDVPPGPHAIVLSTFADSDGAQLLGQGCTEADLSAGSQICFDLTITPAPDGGDDLNASVCSTTPDSCPTGSYCNGMLCVPGCKSDPECPRNDAGVGGACDPATHTCTDCNVDGDCGSAPGAACCKQHCVNTKSDLQNCNGCGLACTGANTQCCNGACSNPSTDANNCGGCGTACSTLNASTASCGGAMCSWTCNGGFAHCLSGNTGCDTNLGGSGKKLCGTVCVAAASCCASGDCTTPPAPAACYAAGVCSGVGGSCSYALKTGSKVCGATCCNAINGSCNVDCTLACTSGFADCDGDRSNGCETNLAGAGKKLCAGACIPVATCCTAGDCMTPPTPQACYAMAGSCPGAGGTCSYTENAGSQICNTTCCNAIHGSCNAGTCSLNCAGGFFDCNGTPTDGCETSCTPAHASGGCSAGACSVGTCNGGFFDCNSSVADGCECGTSCCTNPLTNMPGCTVTNHTDGFAHAFSDCIPLATVGNNATYSAQLAMDAAAADTSQPGIVSGGWSCTDAMGNDTSLQVCKTVDQTGKTGTCTCWTYNGINVDAGTAGHVYNSTGTTGDRGCFCPTTAANSWN